MVDWLNPAEATRCVIGFGDDYLALVQSLCGPAAGADPGATLRDRYERLFTAANMPPASPALPLFGPMGEERAHERLIAATVRCQRAAARFNELLAAIAAAAAEKLLAALAAPEDAEPPVTSLRELHGLWVRCGEEAYAVAAHGEDFVHAQAELLAATVEWRHEQQQLAETWASALGLPTSAEMDAINQRVQMLRRRIGELEQQHEPQGTARS